MRQQAGNKNGARWWIRTTDPSRVKRNAGQNQEEIVKVPICFVLTLMLAACSSPTAPTPPLSLLGSWTGHYTVTSCTETGSAIGTSFCANVGSGGLLIYAPTQTGTTIGGNLSLGTFSLPVSGNLDQNRVTLGGSGEVVSGATLTLNSFQSTVSGNTMTGTLAFTILVGAPVGAATVQATTTLQR